MNRKTLMFAVLVLTSATFLLGSFACVFGQTSGTEIDRLNPASGIAGKEVNVALQGTINTTNGNFQISVDDSKNNFLTVLANGTALGNAVNVNFAFPSVIPGSYRIVLKDVNSSATAAADFHVAAEGIAAIPTAALLIMLVALAISFINMVLNRALITKMIGWHEYRSMQKEMAEYNTQRMAALRARDEKALEKLKKKESQIQAMQTKMFKPQLILIPITFIYLIIWPFLTGVFPFAVAYIPGINAMPGGLPGVPFFYWYLICSFFFGTIASRVIGVTPIQ